MELASRLKLYVISSSNPSELDKIKDALEGGATAVQLRLKGLPESDILKHAKKLRKLTNEYDALFIVNDYVQVAIESYADGVHLGSEDMSIVQARELSKTIIIGRTVRNAYEAKLAEKQGADYLGAGSIYTSPTKKVPVIGLQTLKQIVINVNIPVVAIGGITLAFLPQVLKTGVAGVAVLSAIMHAESPKAMATMFRSTLDSLLPHNTHH